MHRNASYTAARLLALSVSLGIAMTSVALAQTEITPAASAVSASTNDGNVPGNVVDNNLGTRWSAIGDGQWLQLDLGTVRAVGSVRVAVYQGNTRRNLFDLQVASVAGSWTTVFTGQSSGTTTAEQTYDFPDVDARFVRYLGHGCSDPAKPLTNSVTELSILSGTTSTPTPTPVIPTPTPATPTPTPATLPVKLVVGPAAVTASTNDGNVPGNTVDGSLATRWSANGDGAWIQYDLGAVQSVSYVRLAAYSGNSRQNRFDLQVASVAGAWTSVITGGTTSGTTTQLETHDFADVSARYVRYVGHGSTVGTFNSLAEVEVWGAGCAACPTPTATPRATPTPTPIATATPAPTPTPRPVSGTVFFQNTGTKTGWPNYPQTPQNKGRIDDVTSPVYKGTTAIRFEQTYVQNAPERFHSEVTYFHSQDNGQDRYYGFALYLPTTWHNESVKDNFQQWGTENPGGPWLIMHIDQDHLKAGHPNTIPTTDYGAITKGVWHRTVARLHMANNVPFEFWVDGTRKGSTNCTCSATGGSVRWSAGLYIAYWYDRYRTSGLPSGSQTTRFLYQDQYRIASTYDAADPGNW
jgi:hypothetical protein